MSNDEQTEELARRWYKAYERHDRDAVSQMMADDFEFSSPRDHRLDKRRFFEHCWHPVQQIDVEKVFADGQEAFVRYRLTPHEGKDFRNAEFLRFKNGKLVEVQVYFGSA